MRSQSPQEAARPALIWAWLLAAVAAVLGFAVYPFAQGYSGGSKLE